MTSANFAIINKTNCLLFLFSFFALNSNSQVSWNKSLDHSRQANYGHSVLEISDSGYFVGCLTYIKEDPAGVIIRIDNNGLRNGDHEIVYPDKTFFYDQSFKVMSDQIWSVARLATLNTEIYTPIIFAHNKDGNELWRKEYDFFPFNVNFNRGIIANDNTTITVYLEGEYTNDESEYKRFYGYMILDSVGNEITRHWFPSAYDISALNDIERFPGGGYMISVVELDGLSGVPFEYPITIKRLDDTFGVVWEKRLPNERGCAGKFSFDKASNIYMTWMEDTSNPGVGSPWGSPGIISYSADGIFRWKYIFDDNPRLRLLGNILTTSGGSIISTGLDEPGMDPLQWGWLVSLDTSGVLNWDKKYTIDGISSNFGGFFGDLIETSDTNLLVVGYIHDQYPIDTFAARENAWLLKMDFNGCILEEPCEGFNILSDLKESYLESYASTDLFTLHPNPGNIEMNISIKTPQSYHISILNINGLPMADVSGYGDIITMDTRSLASGVYFVCVTINDSTSVKKFIHE